MIRLRPWILAVVIVSAAWAARPAAAADAAKKPSWLPDSKRALIVCVVEDQVTLSWKSEKGSVYTILYTDTPTGEAKWAPLPGYVQMPGTDKTETLKFKTDPARPRRFNLRVEDASKVKPATRK
ncbi:MAG: hypothetical protein FJ221_00540 [Lentisphaerae bacterium]|nr:hypothetical protein [Lentisphaerota bacterium]